ncbi:hypothetical protein U1Q18_048795, partial [Sarracenia purpurea var. burkii]
PVDMNDGSSSNNPHQPIQATDQPYLKSKGKSAILESLIPTFWGLPAHALENQHSIKGQLRSWK